MRPELLAPAGDRTCLLAAIENGADAVYFGLQAHNARARAANFGLDKLPETMALLHARGVRGYVTLNTLVFPGELAGVEAILRRVVAAGVDALIVQDLGLVRLIRALTPDIEVHASTQMSVTSAAGVRLAQELGCSRVILARELSVREIEKIRQATELPVEVFVHGALCVAYSGQCLTSEALGGRSANRGECAQACRMPYDVVCDGQVVDLERVKYLLSPQDLAAYDLIPRLVEAGVASLKIEGRLKSPEYVASITRRYRQAIDRSWAGLPVALDPAEVEEMEMTFSRGFSHGFLDGNNHKVLVRGDYAKKRGIFLGTVSQVNGSRVRVDLAARLKPGDGVVFDGDDERGVPEQGGRVYEVARLTRHGRKVEQAADAGLAAGPAELAFGHRDLDVSALEVGQRLWKTDDPTLSKALRQTFEGGPKRLVDVHLKVTAIVGQPLRVEATTASGFHAAAEADEPLHSAQIRTADEAMLREQLGRLGGTIYRLGQLDARLEGGPLVPKSVLNALRRSIVEELDRRAAEAPARRMAEEAVLPQMRESLKAFADARTASAPVLAGDAAAWAELSVLCRHAHQVEPVLAAGVRRLYLDFQHPKTYGESVERIRAIAPDATVYLAPPRIEKPGEAGLFRLLAKQGADGILARNAGGIAFCAERGIPFVADFSLNAANELTVEYLVARGAERVTASYDLSFDQLDDLLAQVPPGWLEVVIHQQMPMFHMEHCVFCAFLSPGTDKTNCGRPCDRHEVKLRDRVGMEHPLHADIGCRNTLYNAVPQTAAEYLPRLQARGARHLRVELLDDTPDDVGPLLGLYADALAGRRDARTLWRSLRATNRYGVTRGQLAIVD